MRWATTKTRTIGRPSAVPRAGFGCRRSDPQTLFETGSYYFYAPYGRLYDVAPDGRFLMIKIGGPEGAEDRPVIDFVLNWHTELLERVPVN